MQNIKVIHFFLLIALLLSACTSPVSTPAPDGSVKPGEERAYPIPTIPHKDSSYPEPISPYPMQATPEPLPTYPVQIVPFKLDKPVYEGATEVTGSGPASIIILLCDVTFNGVVLAETVIESDGKFVFKLDSPLEKNHRIGVALGDLSKTNWKNNDFSDQAFFGDESMLLPMIAFFYDTVMVEEKK